MVTWMALACFIGHMRTLPGLKVGYQSGGAQHQKMDDPFKSSQGLRSGGLHTFRPCPCMADENPPIATTVPDLKADVTVLC